MKRSLYHKIKPDLRSLLQDKGRMSELGSRLRIRQHMGKMKHARKTKLVNGVSLFMILLSFNAYSQPKDFEDKLKRFDTQSTVGSSLFFAGGAVIGAGFLATENEKTKETCLIVGGATSFVGLLIYMTAYKQFRYDRKLIYEGTKLTYRF